MRANPSAPINLVEEPVHNHQQNNDCQKPRGSLQIECGYVVAERADDAHCYNPRNQAGDKRHARTERDRLAMHAFGTWHTGSDGSPHTNASQSLSKNEKPDVEARDGRTPA